MVVTDQNNLRIRNGKNTAKLYYLGRRIDMMGTIHVSLYNIYTRLASVLLADRKKPSEYLFYSTTTPPELTRPDQTRSDLT